MQSTTARQRRRVLILNFFAPKLDPKYAPINAAIIQLIIAGFKLMPFILKAINPEMEFNKIKSAETAAASLRFAHDKRIITGVSNIPPPIPIKPDINPIIQPINKANGIFIV